MSENTERQQEGGTSAEEERRRGGTFFFLIHKPGWKEEEGIKENRGRKRKRKNAIRALWMKDDLFVPENIDSRS